MTWRSIFIVLISMVIGRIIFYLLDKQASKKIEPTKGVSKLKMLGFYLYFGLFCLSFGLMLSFPILRNFKEEGAPLLLVLALSFIALGVYIVGFGRNHALRYSEQDFEVKNWKGKPTLVKWNEVEHIQYIKSKGVFQFRTKSGSVNCHFHLKGITQFLQFAQHKCQMEVQF